MIALLCLNCECTLNFSKSSSALNTSILTQSFKALPSMYRVWGFALYVFIYLFGFFSNDEIVPSVPIKYWTIFSFWTLKLLVESILFSFWDSRERWNLTWILTFKIYIDVPYFCSTHFTCSLTNFLGLEIRSKLVQNILSINCAIKFQPYHLVQASSLFCTCKYLVRYLEYKVAR